MKREANNLFRRLMVFFLVLVLTVTSTETGFLDGIFEHIIEVKADTSDPDSEDHYIKLPNRKFSITTTVGTAIPSDSIISATVYIGERLNFNTKKDAEGKEYTPQYFEKIEIKNPTISDGKLTLPNIPVYVEYGTDENGEDEDKRATYVTDKTLYTIEYRISSGVTELYNVSYNKQLGTLTIDPNELKWTATHNVTFSKKDVSEKNLEVKWYKENGGELPYTTSVAPYLRRHSMSSERYYTGKSIIDKKKTVWTINYNDVLTTEYDNNDYYACFYHVQGYSLYINGNKVNNNSYNNFKLKEILDNNWEVVYIKDAPLKGTITWYDTGDGSSVSKRPDFNTNLESKVEAYNSNGDAKSDYEIEWYASLDGVNNKYKCHKSGSQEQWYIYDGGYWRLLDNGLDDITDANSLKYWSYDIIGLPMFDPSTKLEQEYYVKITDDSIAAKNTSVEKYRVIYDNLQNSTVSDKIYNGGIIHAVLDNKMSDDDVNVKIKWYDDDDTVSNLDRKSELGLGITVSLWRYPLNGEAILASPVCDANGNQYRKKLDLSDYYDEESGDVQDIIDISLATFGITGSKAVPVYNNNGVLFKYYVQIDDRGDKYNALYYNELYLTPSGDEKYTDFALSGGEIKLTRYGYTNINAEKKWKATGEDDYKEATVTLQLQRKLKYVPTSVWENVTDSEGNPITKEVKANEANLTVSKLYSDVLAYEENGANAGREYTYRLIETKITNGVSTCDLTGSDYEWTETQLFNNALSTLAGCPIKTTKNEIVATSLSYEFNGNRYIATTTYDEANKKCTVTNRLVGTLDYNITISWPSLDVIENRSNGLEGSDSMLSLDETKVAYESALSKGSGFVTLRKNGAYYATLKYETEEGVPFYRISFDNGSTYSEKRDITVITSADSIKWKFEDIVVSKYDSEGVRLNYSVSDSLCTTRTLFNDETNAIHDGKVNVNNETLQHDLITYNYNEASNTATANIPYYIDTPGGTSPNYAYVSKEWVDNTTSLTTRASEVKVARFVRDLEAADPQFVLDTDWYEAHKDTYGVTLCYSNNFTHRFNITSIYSDFSDEKNGEGVVVKDYRYYIIETAISINGKRVEIDPASYVIDSMDSAQLASVTSAQLIESDEIKVNSYEAVNEKTGDTTVITNRVKGENKIYVETEWEDNHNDHGYRGAKYRVELYRNEEETPIKTINVNTPADGAKEYTADTFGEMFLGTYPAFDENGSAYHYSTRQYVVYSDDAVQEIKSSDTANTTLSKFVVKDYSTEAGYETDGATVVPKHTFKYKNSASVLDDSREFYVVWHDEAAYNNSSRPDIAYTLYYTITDADGNVSEKAEYTKPYTLNLESADGSNPFYQKIRVSGVIGYDLGNEYTYFLKATTTTTTHYNYGFKYYEDHTKLAANEDVIVGGQTYKHRDITDGNTQVGAGEPVPENGVILSTISDLVNVRGNKSWINLTEAMYKYKPNCTVYLFRLSDHDKTHEKPADPANYNASKLVIAEGAGTYTGETTIVTKDDSIDEDYYVFREDNSDVLSALKAFDKYDKYGSVYTYSVGELAHDKKNNLIRTAIIGCNSNVNQTLINTYNIDTNTRKITLSKQWKKHTVDGDGNLVAETDIDFSNNASKPYAHFIVYRGKLDDNENKLAEDVTYSDVQTFLSTKGLNEANIMTSDTVEKVAEKYLRYNDEHSTNGGLAEMVIGDNENLFVISPDNNPYVYFVVEDKTYASSYEVSNGYTAFSDKLSSNASGKLETCKLGDNVIVVGNYDSLSDGFAENVKTEFKNIYEESTFLCFTGKLQWIEGDTNIKSAERPAVEAGKTFPEVKLSVTRNAVNQTAQSNTDSYTYDADKLKVEWEDLGDGYYSYRITEKDDAGFLKTAVNGKPYSYTVNLNYNAGNQEQFKKNYAIYNNKTTKASNTAVGDELKMDASHLSIQLLGAYTISKKWQDGYDLYGLRPAGVTVYVQYRTSGSSEWKFVTKNDALGNKTTTPYSFVLNTENSWKQVLNRFPHIDEDGSAYYSYRAVEVKIGDVWVVDDINITDVDGTFTSSTFNSDAVKDYDITTTVESAPSKHLYDNLATDTTVDKNNEYYKSKKEYGSYYIYQPKHSVATSTNISATVYNVLQGVNKGSVTMVKSWEDDNDNQYNLRPSKLTFKVYKLQLPKFIKTYMYMDVTEDLYLEDGTKADSDEYRMETATGHYNYWSDTKLYTDAEHTVEKEVSVTATKNADNDYIISWDLDTLLDENSKWEETNKLVTVTSASCTISGNEWKRKFDDLPMFDVSGSRFAYAVVEVGKKLNTSTGEFEDAVMLPNTSDVTLSNTAHAGSYILKDCSGSFTFFNDITKSPSGTISIANRLAEKQDDVTVKKNWLVQGGNSSATVDSYVSRIILNQMITTKVGSEDVVTKEKLTSVDLKRANDFTYTFVNLPKYDADMNEISITAEESSISVGGEFTGVSASKSVYSKLSTTQLIDTIDYTLNDSDSTKVKLSTDTNGTRWISTYKVEGDNTLYTFENVPLVSQKLEVTYSGDVAADKFDYSEVTRPDESKIVLQYRLKKSDGTYYEGWSDFTNTSTVYPHTLHEVAYQNNIYSGYDVKQVYVSQVVLDSDGKAVATVASTGKAADDGDAANNKYTYVFENLPAVIRVDDQILDAEYRIVEKENKYKEKTEFSQVNYDSDAFSSVDTADIKLSQINAEPTASTYEEDRVEGGYSYIYTTGSLPNSYTANSITKLEKNLYTVGVSGTKTWDDMSDLYGRRPVLDGTTVKDNTIDVKVYKTSISDANRQTIKVNWTDSNTTDNKWEYATENNLLKYEPGTRTLINYVAVETKTDTDSSEAVVGAKAKTVNNQYTATYGGSDTASYVDNKATAANGGNISYELKDISNKLNTKTLTVEKVWSDLDLCNELGYTPVEIDANILVKVAGGAEFSQLKNADNSDVKLTIASGSEAAKSKTITVPLYNTAGQAYTYKVCETRVNFTMDSGSKTGTTSKDVDTIIAEMNTAGSNSYAMNPFTCTLSEKLTGSEITKYVITNEPLTAKVTTTVTWSEKINGIQSQALVNQFRPAKTDYVLQRKYVGVDGDWEAVPTSDLGKKLMKYYEGSDTTGTDGTMTSAIISVPSKAADTQKIVIEGLPCYTVDGDVVKELEYRLVEKTFDYTGVTGVGTDKTAILVYEDTKTISSGYFIHGGETEKTLLCKLDGTSTVYSGENGNYAKSGYQYSSTIKNNLEAANLKDIKATLSGTITWEDNKDYVKNRPDSLTLKLKAIAGGTDTVYTLILNKNSTGSSLKDASDVDYAGVVSVAQDDNLWNYSIKDVPLYDVSGNPISYSVYQDVNPTSYYATVDDNDGQIVKSKATGGVVDAENPAYYTFGKVNNPINTYVGEAVSNLDLTEIMFTELEIVKTWSDRDDEFDFRPKGSTFKMVLQRRIVTVNSSTGAIAEVSGDIGEWTNYEEITIPATSEDPGDSNVWKFTKSNLPAYTTIASETYFYQYRAIEKATDGTHGEYLDGVVYYPDGVTPDPDDAPHKGSYYLTEYETSTITDNSDHKRGYSKVTLTNALDVREDIFVEKEWNGDSSFLSTANNNSIKVTLVGYGGTSGNTEVYRSDAAVLTLDTKTNRLMYKWAAVPFFDMDYNVIRWVVEEKSITPEGETERTFSNNETLKDISGKVWSGETNAETGSNWSAVTKRITGTQLDEFAIRYNKAYTDSGEAAPIKEEDKYQYFVITNTKTTDRALNVSYANSGLTDAGDRYSTRPATAKAILQYRIANEAGTGFGEWIEVSATSEIYPYLTDKTGFVNDSEAATGIKNASLEKVANTATYSYKITSLPVYVNVNENGSDRIAGVEYRIVEINENSSTVKYVDASENVSNGLKVSNIADLKLAKQNSTNDRSVLGYTFEYQAAEGGSNADKLIKTFLTDKLTLTKKWEDSNNYFVTRPVITSQSCSDIKVKIIANASTSYSYEEGSGANEFVAKWEDTSATVPNTWKLSVEGLPKYYPGTDTLAVYSIVEDEINSTKQYKASYVNATGDSNDASVENESKRTYADALNKTGNITNYELTDITNTLKTVDLSVEKIWKTQIDGIQWYEPGFVEFEVAATKEDASTDTTADNISTIKLRLDGAANTESVTKTAGIISPAYSEVSKVTEGDKVIYKGTLLKLPEVDSDGNPYTYSVNENKVGIKLASNLSTGVFQADITEYVNDVNNPFTVKKGDITTDTVSGVKTYSISFTNDLAVAKARIDISWVENNGSDVQDEYLKSHFRPDDAGVVLQRRNVTDGGAWENVIDSDSIAIADITNATTDSLKLTGVNITNDAKSIEISNLPTWWIKNNSGTLKMCKYEYRLLEKKAVYTAKDGGTDIIKACEYADITADGAVAVEGKKLIGTLAAYSVDNTVLTPSVSDGVVLYKTTTVNTLKLSEVVKQTATLTGTINWDDSNNQANERPNQINLRLKQHTSYGDTFVDVAVTGNQTNVTVSGTDLKVNSTYYDSSASFNVIDKAGEWRYEITNVPLYDADGRAITYSVVHADYETGQGEDYRYFTHKNAIADSADADKKTVLPKVKATDVTRNLAASENADIYRYVASSVMLTTLDFVEQSVIGYEYEVSFENDLEWKNKVRPTSVIATLQYRPKNSGSWITVTAGSDYVITNPTAEWKKTIAVEATADGKSNVTFGRLPAFSIADNSELEYRAIQTGAIYPGGITLDVEYEDASANVLKVKTIGGTNDRASGGYTFAYTHDTDNRISKLVCQLLRADINGEKIWSDQSNIYNTRPLVTDNVVKISLYQNDNLLKKDDDSEVAITVTDPVTTDNSWNYTTKNGTGKGALPKYSAGTNNYANYMIKEETYQAGSTTVLNKQYVSDKAFYQLGNVKVVDGVDTFDAEVVTNKLVTDKIYVKKQWNDIDTMKEYGYTPKDAKMALQIKNGTAYEAFVRGGNEINITLKYTDGTASSVDLGGGNTMNIVSTIGDSGIEVPTCDVNGNPYIYRYVETDVSLENGQTYHRDADTTEITSEYDMGPFICTYGTDLYQGKTIQVVVNAPDGGVTFETLYYVEKKLPDDSYIYELKETTTTHSYINANVKAVIKDYSSEYYHHVTVDETVDGITPETKTKETALVNQKTGVKMYVYYNIDPSYTVDYYFVVDKKEYDDALDKTLYKVVDNKYYKRNDSEHFDGRIVPGYTFTIGNKKIEKEDGTHFAAGMIKSLFDSENHATSEEYIADTLKYFDNYAYSEKSTNSADGNIYYMSAKNMVYKTVAEHEDVAFDLYFDVETSYVEMYLIEDETVTEDFVEIEIGGKLHRFRKVYVNKVHNVPLESEAKITDRSQLYSDYKIVEVAGYEGYVAMVLPDGKSVLYQVFMKPVIDTDKNDPALPINPNVPDGEPGDNSANQEEMAPLTGDTITKRQRKSIIMIGIGVALLGLYFLLKQIEKIRQKR